MVFTSPSLLYWLLLAIPIALLYFVALVRRRRELSSIAHWRQALTRRGVWTRWRRLVSLAAVLFALVLLVVAAAEPRFTSGGDRSLVIIVDNSASMRANDVVSSRFEQSKSDVAAILASLRGGDRAAILSAGSLTRVHCRLTSDHVVLDHALDAVAVTDGRTNLAAAVSTARRLLAGVDNPHIIVLTDGCFDDAALAGADDIRWIVHRGEGENVAITRFETRLDEETQQHAFFVEVTNLGAAPQSFGLKVEAVGRQLVLLEESLTLEPGDSQRRFGDLSSDQGDVLSASLKTDDALASDNFARCLLAPRRKIYVRNIGEPSVVLDRALQSNSRFGFIPTPLPPDSSPVAIEKLWVINQPTERTEFPDGPLLVIAPQADAPGLWKYAGLTPGDKSADAARTTNTSSNLGELGRELEDVAIDETVAIEWQVPHVSVAAMSNGQPLATFADRPNGKGRVVVLHAPIESGDLAQHAAFPLLIARLLELALGDDASSTSGADYSTAATVAYPNAGAAVELQTPNGETLVLRRDGKDEWATFVTLDQVGPWRAVAEDKKLQSVVYANLVDQRESDILSAADLVSGPWDEPARTRLPLWIVFAVAGLFAVAVEWTLFRRGVLE